MAQPSGYAIITDPDARLPVERDTFTCCHCNRIIFVRPGSGTERGFCLNCMQPHCGSERCFTCAPFEAKLEEWEGRRQLWQSFRQV